MNAGGLLVHDFIIFSLYFILPVFSYYGVEFALARVVSIEVSGCFFVCLWKVLLLSEVGSVALEVYGM